MDFTLYVEQWLIGSILTKHLAITSFSSMTLCACHQECGPRLCRKYHKAGLEYFDCVSMSVCANVATVRHSATKHYMCLVGIKMQVEMRVISSMRRE